VDTENCWGGEETVSPRVVLPSRRGAGDAGAEMGGGCRELPAGKKGTREGPADNVRRGLRARRVFRVRLRRKTTDEGGSESAADVVPVQQKS